MIQLDLSILNQKGTPMFNSDIFANRPTFGIVGRIFISTDTSQIFRDTGTSYVLISDTSSGGTITGSGTTGTLPLWSGSNSLGNSTLLEAATQISTTKSIKANALFLNDATLGTGVIYFNVAANRVTLANYNAGGILVFETNGGVINMTLDASANLSVVGSITAASIIKSGGLSTQFLKADGSVSTLTNPVTGTGTTGTLPLWSGSTSLGDSLITQSGSNITVSAKNFISNTFTAISLLNPLALSVGTNNTFDGGITWPSLEPCDNVEFLQNNNYNGNITYLNSNYTANHLILSGFQFLSASTTITSNQTTGIRALSNQILQARINGSNNGTITHFANSLVYGDFAASTARFNFTNRYGYLVNNLDEYGAGHTYTNRYAFYNQGASDHNHFAGKMLLNTLTVTSDQLSVVGTTLLNGALSGTSAVFSSSVTAGNGAGFILNYNVNASSRSWSILNDQVLFGDFQIQQSTTQTGTARTTKFYISPSGNIGIGNSNDTYKLDVSGSANFTGALSGTSATFSSSVIINGSSLDINPASGQPNITLRTGNTFRGYIEGNSSGGMSFGTGASAAICLTLASTGAATFSSSTSLSAIFNSTTNNPYISFSESSSSKFFIGQRGSVSGDGGTGYDLYTVAGNDIRFFSGAIKVLTLATTGAATFTGALSGTSASFGSTVYSGVSSINASAQLQADSTTLGFLPPRMTTTQKNAIAAPAAGLIVYDSTLNKLCVRTAAAWETITSI